MHGEGGGNVQLSAAVQVCIRPGPTIQFGVDSARAGVFDAVAATAVQPVALALLTARHAVPVRTVSAGLVAAGLSDAAARSLIEDLLNYRVLHPVPAEPMAAVCGTGVLAERIAGMLRQCGVTVRLPVPGESDAAFVARATADHALPVVAVHPSAAAAHALAGHASTWFPVQLIDGRGHLGPLHIDGVGACPMCLELWRAALDPTWGALDPWEPAPAPDPPVVAATVARVVACVVAYLRYGPEPPGTQAVALAPGDVQEIDVYAEGIRHWHVAAHPGCPACWSATG
ncbi:hypothetical protein [Corynebacterium sp.]|uniref:hypothetical protein n=1 Tax=Corynebacterium sp. TaxID=1720 RepID=UPI0026DC0AD3|nr:hypothetical protein [Corynebacterium sp.]MDO5077279.1 hypothetical protein [Corynebacterium sp.]